VDGPEIDLVVGNETMVQVIDQVMDEKKTLKGILHHDLAWVHKSTKASIKALKDQVEL